MTYKFHTRLDLINGGNIFRQDDKITLGYIARNSNGEAIDFSGKEIMGTIYNRRAGIMYEAEASFDADSQKIIFTITQTLDHGTFEIEFVVTDPGNVNYRVVVPSDEYSGRLDIKPSSANIEVTGVRMVTVEQLRSEQQLAQSTYEEKVDGKVQQLETGFTNHKNAVDLVVEDVQQKSSAAEMATQTANDAASAATSAASSADTAASSANEQAGAAQQAATDATAASTAANSSADRANTAAGNAEGIVDEFSTYKDSTAKTKVFGTVDDRFEELERDSYLPAVNGAIYPWTTSSSNIQQELNGEVIFTATQYGGYIQTLVLRNLNHRYYASVEVQADTNLVQFGILTSPLKQHSGNGQYERLSGAYDAPTSTSGAIRVQDLRTSAFSQIKVKKPLIIDLTETFGAGNEPSAAEMDALLAFYPSSWFNDTINLAENRKLMTFLLNQIRAKAKKQQEGWIEPTLLNGWTSFDAARTFKYRKDEFGKVHFKGSIKGGTRASTICVLPVGYRPAQTSHFVVNGNNTNFATVYTSGGNIVFAEGLTTHVGMDSISYYTD